MRVNFVFDWPFLGVVADSRGISDFKSACVLKRLEV